MSKLQGVVKFYNEAKGFGFIKQNDGGEDVFVHATGLLEKIYENEQVEFEVTTGKKGLSAVNVKVVE